MQTLDKTVRLTIWFIFSLLILLCYSSGAIFQTPGPGAYSPETPTYNTQRKPPSYTMGSRTQYRPVDTVPAPNKYSLPSLLGPQVPNKVASACYTMSGFYKTGGPSEDLSKTPGPGDPQPREGDRQQTAGPSLLTGHQTLRVCDPFGRSFSRLNHLLRKLSAPTSASCKG